MIESKNEYVAAKFSHISALQIAKAPGSQEAIAQYQQEHESTLADPHSKSAKIRARRGIRRQRPRAFLDTAEPEPTEAEKRYHPEVCERKQHHAYYRT